MGSKRRKKRDQSKKQPKLHHHYLYTAAVQSVESDLKFFRRIYKNRNGRSFQRLREDFCGTAVLACDWVRRGADHEAWGVDLDRPTLDWGVRHYHPRLGKAASRVHLLCDDVLEVTTPDVDLIAALNFSYSVFKTRDELRAYFRAARNSLAAGGILILDAWGGTEAMAEDLEERRVDAETAFDGTRVPAFTYVWEQARFNPIDHHILCHIHFKLGKGRKIKRAFTYDWRFWTLPELQELMSEAGFASTEVYVEGWDEEEDEADGVFRRRKSFENQEGWVAYVVGYS